MFFSWIKYTDMEGEAFPEWADVLGWLMTMTVVVAIVAGAIFTLCTAEGNFNQVRCCYHTHIVVKLYKNCGLIKLTNWLYFIYI